MSYQLQYLAVEPANGQIVASFRYEDDRDLFNESNGTVTPAEYRLMAQYREQETFSAAQG